MTILFEDISPDVPNFTPLRTPETLGQSTAGLTLQVVGHEGELYAVSLNAGVWRSLTQGPWVQLQGPPGAYPTRAYCIAMDPGNFTHLVVGERDGDAVNPTHDRAGVWESFDSGNTWTCILDPATDAPGGCSSQAIPAIAFGSQGLFVATACGLAIRRSGDSTFQWVSQNPLNGQPITLVTALAVSENKVWARIESRNLQNPTQTDYTLLVWNPPGSPFSPIEPIPIPAQAIFDDGKARGDRFSLAALDSNAYISVLGDTDPQTGNNFNTVLIYDATHGLWLTQRVGDSLNGTGNGGRRFIKMFILGNQNLPLSLGNRLQLFFCGAQDVFRARGFLPSVLGGFTGLIDWESFAHTGIGGPPDPNVHGDIWDLHMINDFDNPGPIHWIAGDGGVFELLPPFWLTRNAGLHTHHIHTLTAVSSNDFSHGLAHSRLAYATSDNDAWFSDTIPTFIAAHCCDDINWTDGDTGNPDFLLTSRHRENATFISFRNAPPTRQNIRLVNYQKEKDANGRVIILDTIGPDGPTTFRFIQSPKGSALPSHLDAVMLVELPLTFWDGNNNIPLEPTSPLGQSSQGRPVLIRNRGFEALPDINQSKGQGWFIEANDLPAGTKGFYVSGGHDSPVYYAYSDQGGGVLYKRSSPATGWQSVLSGLLIGGQFGPAFVDPYNSNRLYVVTPNGVKVSLNGETSFQDETVLTNLLSGSGKFSFNRTFSGINGSNLPISGRANAMSTLSHIAFNLDRPGDVVAASPFTGVFYNHGDGTWLDLTASLPQPLSPVSSVGADYTGIYVGTEGRGILRATTFHSLRLFLESKGVKSVRPLQPTGTISVRSLMGR